MPPQVEGRVAPPRAPQSAKHLYRSKAPERGEFPRKGKEGKPQVGFPLPNTQHPHRGLNYRFLLPADDIQSGASRPSGCALTILAVKKRS